MKISYCPICNSTHDVQWPCTAIRTARAADKMIIELEKQLEGWRNSDTATLIDERDAARRNVVRLIKQRDDAQMAVEQLQKERGMRRHPSGQK